MSEHECKYCEEDLYGDWVSITEGEFCNREHAQLWKKDQRISDLERRNEGLEKAAKKLVRAVESNHKSGGAVDTFSDLQSCIETVKALTRTKEHSNG